MRYAVLFLMMLLAGCGATPNAPATQTRTSEIVELTVAARLLPTANAAIPPTPIPPAATPTLASFTPSAPSSSAAATALWATINAVPTQAGASAFGGNGPTDDRAPLVGSWVAFAPALHVRFFAPPSLVEAPEFNNDHRYSLGSPSNVYDFEALDIYRNVGARGGDFTRTWVAEEETLGKATNVYGLDTTRGPRQQQVGAYQGNVGQFNYVQADNQLRISGTMWVGQVGGDEVLIIYRCTPEREPNLDVEFAQVIRTIDFNAR